MAVLIEIRFLHAADLHLDTPFKGMAHLPERHYQILQNSTFQAFDNLIQYALESQPDFVVIVGDLYDGQERSLRAQYAFQEGMKKLHEASIPVFLSYGNHDHLSGKWTRFDLPDNVHVFESKVERKMITVRGEAVHLYGFSYPKRHVEEAMIEHYPVAAEEEEVHIGLLHGSVEGDKAHAVYAPFTKGELLAKQYDYWALGHIHTRQQLHHTPPIVYPGNLQGRHRHENGEKGFYDVTLSKQQVQMEFQRAAAILYEKVQISCAGIRHAGEWFELCTDQLLPYADGREGVIVSLEVVDLDEQAMQLLNQSTEEEWRLTLNDRLEATDAFVWVSHLRIERRQLTEQDEAAILNPVMEIMEHWTNEEWYEHLKELYQDAKSLNYLEQLTEEDFQDIKNKAYEQLRLELADRK